jgi:putative iron-regulated protein
VQKPNEDITSQILTDYSANVVLYGYQQLEIQSTQLHNDILLFKANPSQALLQKCQADWKSTRSVWEESEACLFGPVSTNSIDPRIDTWPVDFNRLDNILNSSAIFSQAYIDNLEESLKGFHPIEYLLFGRGGTKAYNHFTIRQIEFLLALSENLKTLTSSLKNDWDVNGGNYISEFANAGNGSNLYPTKRSAYEELIIAMVGICDEVANGKIGDVASNLDSMKEESPFAKNSITDFTNNIQGVMYGYLSKNSISDGKGLEDFVRQNNLNMDAAIKQKHNAAIIALKNITVPFGEAIFTQPIQVQNAIDAINALRYELESNLLPLVQLHIK